ncbi:MAG: glycosyltransferase, partial [Thaumarchaeota archaeon]|nr:glycosyltransferase [Nitrososphaerota archaeon]
VKPVEKITKAIVVKTILKQSSIVIEPEKKSETIPRCGHCKKELGFNDRTIRHEKKWYHAECYRSAVQEKPILKQPAKVVELETKTELVPKTFEKAIQIEEKPKPPKKKIFEFTKKPKQVSEIDEEAIPKVKHDPVLFLLAGTLFIFLFSGAYILLPGFSVAAMLLGGSLVMYQLFDAKRSSTKKYREKKWHAPAVFPMFLLILPFVMGGILAYEGYTAWDSAYRAIILWGLTLIFWSTLLMVPLAVYSKNIESQLPNTPNRPMVTIIIPAYNEEKVIGNTIESTLEIAYPNKDIIVVDDGSTDKTLQIAKRYEDEGVKVLHKENGGKATALNYGLTFAKGELVAVLDADTLASRNSLTEIVKVFENEKDIAAVAGNIKVRNKVNWITWCQALEYVAGIQIARRAFDLFGAITIVPGALGSFRKSVLMESGSYDKETIVEDFDTTIKILKSGGIVRGTTKSVAYTEAPNTLMDFYKQRKRWYRGNLQVVIKHRNALTNPRFGFLQKLAFPYMLIAMIILPATGFIVLGSAVFAIIEGDYVFVLASFGFFIVIQYLMTALAVRIDGDDPKLILFSIFFNFGYKQILDYILLRTAIEQLFRRKASWTSAKRIGFDEK